jgi:hypothetical protein
MKRVLLIAAGILCSVASPAAADIRQLNALQVVGGDAEPEGPIPWVQAAFDDKGDYGVVTLTFSPSNLVGSEHVTDLYLNLDPAFDPTKLAFFPIAKHGAFESPTISLGNNAFQADEGGRYDLHFSFASAGGSDAFFGVGDSFDLRIGSLIALPIVASSFDVPSTSEGADPFYLAARIAGIGTNNGAAWVVAAPEPTTSSLALIGVFALLLAVRGKGPISFVGNFSGSRYDAERMP